jgi:hypothetical protein
MPMFCQLVPWSVEAGAVVLIGQRNLIQAWADGKPADPKRIPDWAGQGTTVGGMARDSESPDAAALRLFHEQTGIDLSGSEAAKRYAVQGRQLSLLQGQDYATYPVLYVSLGSAGMVALQKDAQANLDRRAVRDGVLLELQSPQNYQAKSRLGPVPEPSIGWERYLVLNYFGGREPGPFNLQIKPLTDEITRKTKMPDVPFRLALEGLDGILGIEHGPYWDGGVNWTNYDAIGRQWR